MSTELVVLAAPETLVSLLLSSTEVTEASFEISSSSSKKPTRKFPPSSRTFPGKLLGSVVVVDEVDEVVAVVVGLAATETCDEWVLH
jgi:hypothetical protein